MLNSVYQLITPKTISVKHEDVDTKDQAAAVAVAKPVSAPP